MKMGSSEECDLQIFLPSLLPVHIVVDFMESRVTAVGNDVHCNTIPVLPGNGITLNNDSTVRILRVFVIFLIMDALDEANIYDIKIEMAPPRLKEYSPALKIAHRVDSLETV